MPQNPTPKMCQCCAEHKALNDKMDGHECITEHPDFNPICLTPAVLHIVVNSMEEVRGYGINIDDWTNRYAEIPFLEGISAFPIIYITLFN